QKFMTRTGKITFFSSTPIENIEAVNNDVSSVMDAKSGELVFMVPIKSFRFENATMQGHFNESYMESDKFPRAEFRGKILNLGDVNLAKDGTYNTKVSGKMTIHGVTRDVTAPGTITVKGGKLTATSKFNVRTADYGIKIPAMTAKKIAESIEVTVNSILSPAS
ncbi:MAG TPA: YceI family protein, partial [Fibrella sp.]